MIHLALLLQGEVAPGFTSVVNSRVGRRLLGASNTIAGVAVQGDLGWWKLEERKKDIKVLFGRDERDLTGEDGNEETERGRRNMVVE